MKKLALALVQFAVLFVLGHSAACATAQPQVATAANDADQRFVLRQKLEAELRALEAQGPLHFETDTDALDTDAKRVLREVAAQLFDHPEAGVVVAGHADERGDTAYNLALGERRAQAAQEYLVRLGVKAARIKLISIGEEQPLLSGHDESAWAVNRRDEFTFLLPSMGATVAGAPTTADMEALSPLVAFVRLDG